MKLSSSPTDECLSEIHGGGLIVIVPLSRYFSYLLVPPFISHAHTDSRILSAYACVLHANKSRATAPENIFHCATKGDDGDSPAS